MSEQEEQQAKESAEFIASFDDWCNEVNRLAKAHCRFVDNLIVPYTMHKWRTRYASGLSPRAAISEDSAEWE